MGYFYNYLHSHAFITNKIVNNALMKARLTSTGQGSPHMRRKARHPYPPQLLLGPASTPQGRLDTLRHHKSESAKDYISALRPKRQNTTSTKATATEQQPLSPTDVLISATKGPYPQEIGQLNPTIEALASSLSSSPSSSTANAAVISSLGRIPKKKSKKHNQLYNKGEYRFKIGQPSNENTNYHSSPSSSLSTTKGINNNSSSSSSNSSPHRDIKAIPIKASSLSTGIELFSLGDIIPHHAIQPPPAFNTLSQAASIIGEIVVDKLGNRGRKIIGQRNIPQYIEKQFNHNVYPTSIASNNNNSNIISSTRTNKGNRGRYTSSLTNSTSESLDTAVTTGRSGQQQQQQQQRHNNNNNNNDAIIKMNHNYKILQQRINNMNARKEYAAKRNHYINSLIRDNPYTIRNIKMLESSMPSSLTPTSSSSASSSSSSYKNGRGNKASSSRRSSSSSLNSDSRLVDASIATMKATPTFKSRIGRKLPMKLTYTPSLSKNIL